MVNTTLTNNNMSKTMKNLIDRMNEDGLIKVKPAKWKTTKLEDNIKSWLDEDIDPNFVNLRGER